MTERGPDDSRLGLPPRPIQYLLAGLLIAAIVALAVVAFNRDTGPASPVEGIVVSVESESLTNVRRFTLRLEGGTTLEFEVGTLENATEFSPSHLSEHLATSSPIRVSFVRTDNGERVAYRLEDAVPSTTPSPAAS